MSIYDENGNYIYPEGFDPETNEWLPGHEEQKAEWERQYAEAHAKWEAHKAAVSETKKADAEADAAAQAENPTSFSSDTPVETGLAADETLQALKDQLSADEA